MTSEFTVKFRCLESYFEPQPSVGSKIRETGTNAGINMNPNTKTSEDGSKILEGKISKYGIEARYEWEISPRNPESIPTAMDVTETVYLRTAYKINLGFLCFLLASVPIGYHMMVNRIASIFSFYLPGVAVTALLLNAYVILPGHILPHGVNENDSSLHILSEEIAFTRVIILIFLITLVGVFSPKAVQPIITYTSSIAMILLGLLSITSFERLVKME